MRVKQFAGALLLVAAAPEARALWDDRLELFVAASATRDDNLFRLPEQSDPLPVLGTDSTADSYRTTSFGINVDVPVSAQRFVGTVAYDRFRFDEFTDLDHDGYTKNVFWLWSVGAHADGRLGYTEDRVLTALSNLQSGVQSSTPNFLTAAETLFTTTYNPATRWRVRGAVTTVELTRRSRDGAARLRPFAVRPRFSRAAATKAHRAALQRGEGHR